MTEATYHVVRRSVNCFDVEMGRPNGDRTMVGGFGSEHEATAWIVQAQRMVRAAGPWKPLAPRDRKLPKG
jgi:hypothetical protein